MNADDMRELARLLAIESQAAARKDCSTCRHSVYADLKTAQNLRAEQNYGQGRGMFLYDKGFICEKHRLIAPTPCHDFERSPKLQAPP